METNIEYSRSGNPTKIVRTYDSWHEVIDHALDIERTEREGEWDYLKEGIECGVIASRQASLGDEWDLGCDWDRTCEMVRADGWAEGLDLVSEMSESFESVIGSRMLSHEPQYHVSGACVDVAAYLSGEPECFLDFAEVEKPGAGKVLSIGIEVSMGKHEKATTIMRRGAAIVALIDMLEAGGYQTEVVAIVHSINRSPTAKMVILIPMKRASEPIPLERAAFALCHPAMLRRIVFSLLEQLPERVRKMFGIIFCGHYGKVVFPPPYNPDEYGFDIYLANSVAGFVSRQAAHKWLLRTLKDNGIELAQSPDALSVP